MKWEDVICGGPSTSPRPEPPGRESLGPDSGPHLSLLVSAPPNRSARPSRPLRGRTEPTAWVLEIKVDTWTRLLINSLSALIVDPCLDASGARKAGEEAGEVRVLDARPRPRSSRYLLGPRVTRGGGGRPRLWTQGVRLNRRRGRVLTSRFLM